MVQQDWHTPMAVAQNDIQTLKGSVSEMQHDLNDVSNVAHQAVVSSNWAVDAVTLVEKRIDTKFDELKADVKEVRNDMKGKAVREYATLITALFTLLGIIATLLIR